MPKLKTLSGEDTVKILQSFGFTVANQRGSHIKLQRFYNSSKQTITIPNHKELDKGTLKAVYNQILKYISEDELQSHFYSK